MLSFGLIEWNLEPSHIHHAVPPKKCEIRNEITWLCPCIKRARNICIWRVFPWFNDDDRKSMKEIKYKAMTFFNRPPCFFSIAAKRRWEKTYMGLLGPIITRTYIRILYIGSKVSSRFFWSCWASNHVCIHILKISIFH